MATKTATGFLGGQGKGMGIGEGEVHALRAESISALQGTARSGVLAGDWKSYMACLDQINDPELSPLIVQRFGSADMFKRACAADYVGGQLQLGGTPYKVSQSRVFTPDALDAISASNQLRRTLRHKS